ncbi:MAG: Rieske (2Fe-2S) protein [Flexilinea sp.]|jgi:3-phenylpropionate/trans-cinnamate dioxygenase ferredoxin subunit
MKFVKIAQASEFNGNSKKKILFNEREILLVRIKKMFYALDNKCPHMGGSLFDGDLEGNNIVCPRHGSVFDVRTGEVVRPGKLLFVKVKVNAVHSYPIKMEGDDILIGTE